MYRPQYDTAEGIATYLTDLTSINRLVRDRHNAYYERKERLNQFCIMGRWITDTCGNFGPIVADDRMEEKIPALMGKCPPVMDVRELELFMRGKMYTWSHSWPFPPDYATCDVCGEKWTLDNCHDFQNRQDSDEASLEDFVGQPLASVTEIPSLKGKLWHHVDHDSVYNETYEGESRKGSSGKKWHYVPKDYVIQPGDRAMLQTMLFTHKGCYTKKVQRRSREEMEDIFKKAGFPHAQLISIPNQYCPCDRCPPWYTVQVDDLEPITIGWRKRVISIKWNKLALDHLFKEEDVTKEPHLIHAWTEDKASEYLSKILPALGATPK